MSSKAFKSAFWYTGSNLLVKALGFITIPIFTRLLTHAEFGVYNNYLSWLAVMTIVVTLSLDATLISAKRDYPNDLRNYTFSMVVLSQISAAVWLVLSNCFMSLFEAVSDLDAIYVNCIFVYLLFLPAITLIQTWERFVYKYKVTVALSLAMSIGIALLSVALALLMPNHLEGVIVGRTIPVVLLGGSIFLWFIAKKSAISVSYWRYALPVAWPFIPHLLAMTLLGAMNKIFITQMCGADANALYSLAYSCGLIVALFVTSLNSAFSPWLGDKLTERNYDRIRRVSRPYVALFAVFAFISTLIAPEVLLLMGGTSYLPAMYVIPPIAMGCVFQFVYCMYVNVEQYEKKTKGMALASLSAAALNALLDIIFIPMFGYMVAAWATAISYGWLMIAHMLLVRRMRFSFVYDWKFNIAFCALTCVCIGFCMILYGAPVVRWTLIFLLVLASVILIWLKRKLIAAVLKRS